MVTIAVMKRHDQKQVGEERLYLAYTSASSSVIEGSQDRTSNRAGTPSALSHPSTSTKLLSSYFHICFGAGPLQATTVALHS